MAPKISHGPEVAALAAVVRAVFSYLEARGTPATSIARAALEVVERFVRGEAVDDDELQRAADSANEEGVPRAQREANRSMLWANGAAGNLAWMAKKDRGWQEGTRATMDAAEYALSSLPVESSTPDVPDREALEAIRVVALSSARETPRTKRPKKSPKPAKNARRLAALAPHLGDRAFARLEAQKPVFDPAGRVTDEELRRRLEARGYHAHDGVLAFDRLYGGLVVAEDGEAGMDWIFGAFACLRSRAHEGPGGGERALVAVVYSPNDVIYYLDAQGAGWAEDSIEDPAPVRVADDGDGMVAQLILDQFGG